ncbi:670_t:CDS:1, partial [Racocetra persica]
NKAVNTQDNYQNKIAMVPVVASLHIRTSNNENTSKAPRRVNSAISATPPVKKKKSKIDNSGNDGITNNNVNDRNNSESAKKQ